MRQQDLHILDPAILPSLESRSGCLLGSLAPHPASQHLEGPILHCYAINPARPCNKAARLRTSCTSMPRRRTPSVPSRGAACCSRTCVISRSCGREGENGGASSRPMGATAPACHKPTAVRHLSPPSQRQSAECRQGCQPVGSLQRIHKASRRRYQQPGTNAVVQHARQQ